MDMETAEDTIIGRIHEPMPPNTREWLEAWKSDDPEVCCVCLNDDCSSSNSFVYCSDESCEVIVHQNCYAIHKLPSKQEPWYCDRCAAIREDETCLVSCALCPSTIGAFRKLKVPHHGIQWVHVICALRIRGVKISNSRNVSGITVPDQESKSWKGQCSICENPLLADYGAYQICSEGGCTKKLHVTCAMKYSAHVDAENLWTMRCLDHHTSGELTVNQWEKWVDRRDEHLKSKASALCQEAWKAAIERTGPKNLVECSIVFSHLEDSSDSALSDGVGEIQSDGAGETQSDGVDTAQKPKATSTHERNVASPKPASQVTSGKAKSRTSSASQRGTPDSDIPDPKSGSPSKKTSDRPKESAVNGLGQRKRWLEPIIESLRKHEKEGPLKCSECGQETVPTQTIESLGITDDDILALNESKKTRVYGFTGSGKLWDPRVFIECTKCNKLYHCGCIDPPVKNYPSR
ncbi:PHD-zinc-finger like domain-containing protein [Dichotomocladium elegans]|nr:PHD-zinc-finger like domain-containing protein [Dichotomocladium elegans]